MWTDLLPVAWTMCCVHIKIPSVYSRLFSSCSAMLDQIIHSVTLENSSNSSTLPNASAVCPRIFDCTGSGTSLTSFDIGTAPTYVSIVSSSLSCAGSLLILLTYWLLKEMRNVAQKIITVLAIADFITAFGYLLAAWNFLTHFNQVDHDSCVVFQTVCKVQSFVTTWSTLCSFGWTVALALHFYLLLRLHKHQLMVRILILENILVWLLPLAIVIPMLATGHLGYTRYATSNWCYVTDNMYPSNHELDLQENGVTIVLMLFAGNLWEMLSYVVVIVMYGLTRRQFRKQITQAKARQEQSGASEQPPVKDSHSEVEHRLLLIPIVFILLRMWGTIQFFFSIATSAQNQRGCIPHAMHTTYVVLGILQAIGDGGQGWGNAFLYIFLSSTIRRELLFSPCARLIQCTGARLRRIGETLETVKTNWNDTSVLNISRRDAFRGDEANPLIRRKQVVNYSTSRPARSESTAAPSMLDQAAPGPYSESIA